MWKGQLEWGKEFRTNGNGSKNRGVGGRRVAVEKKYCIHVNEIKNLCGARV